MKKKKEAKVTCFSPALIGMLVNVLANVVDLLGAVL